MKRASRRGVRSTLGSQTVKSSVVWVFVLLGISLSVHAAEPIDGRVAPRLLPQRGWTPSRLADRYAATADKGWLRLSVGGRGKQMTWTLTPTAAEMAGEPRYLRFRYRAVNINTTGSDMVLSAQTSNPDWIHLINTKHLVADGREHVPWPWTWPATSSPSPLERLLRVGRPRPTKPTCG